MTSVTTAESGEDLSGLALDRVEGVTGHVILVEGPDENGSAAVGLWHVSTTGQPVGAWVRRTADLRNDPTTADELLRLTSHRAVFGWDTTTSDRLLTSLAAWAGWAEPPRPVPVLLGEVLAEIAEHRRAHAAAVAEHQAVSKSKPASLKWPHEVPSVGSWSEFVAATRLPRPQARSEVAAEALHLVRGLAWAVELWHETETARVRRSYLVDRFGPAAELPPRWLARLREAHAAGARTRGGDGSDQ